MVEKNWKRRNSKSALYKWENIGQELIGTLSNVKDGKYGKLAEIVTTDGEVTIALSAALGEIADLETGTELKIIYEGWQETKSGQRFRGFLWFTAEDDSSAPLRSKGPDSTPPASETKSDADVVPF